MTSKEVYCCCESVYAPGVVYGNLYHVLETRDEQFLMVNEQGKQRWYPHSCFSSQPVLKLLSWKLDDPVEQPFCEVTLCLSDGQTRWCIFATPDDFKHHGDWLNEAQSVRWHSPSAHLFVLGQRSEQLIQMALLEVERQGQLLSCSLPLATSS